MGASAIMDHLISLTEPKTKLNNLAAHMPDADDFTCKFAATLALYLNDEMIPEGVNMGCELLLHDLARGKSGYPSIRLPSSLTGQPATVYGIMAMTVPSIVAATFPADFAARFNEVRHEIATMIK